MPEVIDLHSHVLPGLDDGVRTLDEAVALVRAAAAEGVTVLAATPHVRDDYPTTPAAAAAQLTAVREAVRAAGVPVDVIAGGELDLEWLPRLADDELLQLAYGGTRAVLLEFPEGAWPRALEPALDRVARLGLVPVLAHPERNRSVQERPELLRQLVSAGAIVQLTAASVAGHVGRSARACSRALLDRGLAHLLASDAHGPHLRPYALREAVDALGDVRVAASLVQDGPAAVLAGERPVAQKRGTRRRWFGLG